MKYLILDTNVFVRDFQMKGHHFKTLLENHGLVAEKFAIPQVIADEVSSQLKKKVVDEFEKISKSWKNIRKFIGDQLDYSELPCVESILKEYDIQFKSQILDTNFEILEYPPVDIEYLASRSMSRKKPFKINGEGMCDAIIWESILHLLESNSEVEVVFVTENTKDFCDDRGLHRDLLVDLKTSDIAHNRIKHYLTLEEAVQTLVIPHLDTLENLQHKLNTCSFDNFDLKDWLSDQLFDALDASQIGLALYDLTSDDCDLALSEIYEVVSLEAHRVRAISETSRYVRISAEIGLSLDICANYGQHEDHEFLEELFKSWHTFPSPYECVSESDTVEIEFTLVFEKEQVDAGTIEVLTISGKNRKVRCR